MINSAVLQTRAPTTYTEPPFLKLSLKSLDRLIGNPLSTPMDPKDALPASLLPHGKTRTPAGALSLAQLQPAYFDNAKLLPLYYVP